MTGSIDNLLSAQLSSTAEQRATSARTDVNSTHRASRNAAFIVYFPNSPKKRCLFRSACGTPLFRGAMKANLTPVWCAEWGGLLNFLGRDGNVAEAFTPAWNALNFLKVPQEHFVGAVAGFVAEQRLSFSGWVRRR